jgi:hypothetical protein
MSRRGLGQTKILAISGNSKHFSDFSPIFFLTPPGRRGVPPEFLLSLKSYFLGDLKPHSKFQNPTITSSGRKVTFLERRRRRNAVNSGHLVP